MDNHWVFVDLSRALTAFFLILIALATLFFVSRKRNLAMKALPILVSIFIIGCALHYVIEIGQASSPESPLEPWLLGFTAVMAIVIFEKLVNFIPRALSIPSLKELEQVVKDRTVSLQNSILQLTSEISLREQIETELNSAKEIAESATRSKSQFLASMSHEIRTPLGIMLSLSEQIAKDPQLTAKHGDLLNTIQRNGIILSRVINDILDLSKIEAGKLEIEMQAIEAFSFIQELADTFKFRAVEKGIQFEVEVAEDLPEQFYSDDLRLKQILINLLTNAFKHTSRGRISLRARLSGDRERLVFEVEDSGAGIPAPLQLKIFEAFEQASHVHGGTGLGLTLAKGFASLLRGQLSLIRSEINKGSLFRLEIPNKSPATYLKRAPVEFSGGDIPTLQNKQLLVVDDNEDNLLVLELLLKDTKAQISFVSSGQEAIALARSRRFDLVLMDLQMPEMDGFAALENLRSLGYQGPVGAVSAYAMKDDVKKSRSAGFTFHVSKPIQSRLLYEKLAEFVRE